MNLLTGATGFIGGHVVEYLFQQGEISKGIFRKGSHLKIMDTNGVQGIEADLLDHHSLHDAMDGVDIVYNMASPKPDSDQDFMKTNTEGLLNLLEVATESKVKVFVHLSSLDVFGFGTKSILSSTPFNPTNDYQKSKAEAERLLDEFARRNPGTRVNIIRPAKAVGSRDDSLVVPILRMIEDGRVVLPGEGQMSFTHPRDIAQAMYKAATSQLASGSKYMLKSFDCTAVELGEAITASSGRRAEVRKQGLLSPSKLPRYTAEQLKASTRVGEQPNWKELGYVPQFSLKSTCDEIVTWYKKSPWVTENA